MALKTILSTLTLAGVRQWTKERSKEPSTHAGAAGGLVAVALGMENETAQAAMLIIAGIFALVSIYQKEKGGS